MIGELILEPVLEILFHVVCYYVGRLAVFVTTFGRVECEDPFFEKRRAYNSTAVNRRRNAAICLGAETTAFIGVVVTVLSIAVGFWLRRSR